MLKCSEEPLGLIALNQCIENAKNLQISSPAKDLDLSSPQSLDFISQFLIDKEPVSLWYFEILLKSFKEIPSYIVVNDVNKRLVKKVNRYYNVLGGSLSSCTRIQADLSSKQFKIKRGLFTAYATSAIDSFIHNI
jgi:hypothetical protein